MHYDYQGNDYYSGGVSSRRPYEQPREEAAAQILPAQSEPHPQKKKKRGLRLAALLLACAVVGGAAGYGSWYLHAGDAFVPAMTNIQMGDGSGRTVQQTTVGSGQEMTFTEIYAAYAPSSVGIATETVTTNIFGQTTRGAAAGSGFILTADGYIVTNHHVVADASTITVNMYDGTSYPATLVGSEKDNDIAVLKIAASKLTPVVIGDSETLRVGDPVAAIGNPLGELTFTMTSGIVSALNRSVTTRDGTIYNSIQTDCAVNSGNSGGPMFNSYGEVIGIVSAKYASSGVEGLGFAIPISDVLDMLTDIMQTGYVTGKAYMGVTVSNASLQQTGVSGAYINSITPGSCAQTAGLQVGDIIIAMDGQSVTSKDDLTTLKSTYRAGDSAQLAVVRGRETITLTITFDEQTPQAEAANDQASDQQQQGQGDQSVPGDQDNGYFSWGNPYGRNFGSPVY